MHIGDSKTTFLSEKINQSWTAVLSQLKEVLEGNVTFGYTLTPLEVDED